MCVSRFGTPLLCSWNRGKSLNPTPVGVNEEGGLLKREYNLSVADINDTGRITRPRDGKSVALNKLSIERDGVFHMVHSYEYADMILGAAICSCGKEVERKQVCLLLADGSVLYPALCCGKAIFFDGVVNVDD